MKKRLIKIISQALALLMVIALIAGCGATGDKGDSPTVGTTAPKTTTKATPAEKGDTIKWKGTITVAPYMFGPLDESQNVIKPLLEQGLLEYGYDVDLQHVYIETSDYLNLLNTRLISGDAPDVFEAKGAATMRDYYDQGVIASWDKAFFEQNCPTILNYITSGCVDGRLIDYVDMFWDFAMIGDKMVTVPPVGEGGTELPKVMLLRGDWLENLGVKDLPYTLDEFIDLMYRFRNDDPDGNNQKDTYGFSTSVIHAIFGAFYGYTSFPDPGHSSRIEFYNLDGKIACGDTLPTNKQALEVLAKCYKDGIIDPEFTAQKGENLSGYWALSQPFINGRIGASCHASIDHYRLPEVTGVEGACAKEYFEVNGDYNFVYAPWPAGPEGNYGGWSLGPACGIGENAIYNGDLNKDTDKLAAILSIMDIFAQDDDLAMLSMYGNEGEHFEYTGPSDKQAAQRLKPNEELNAAGVMAYRGVYGGPTPFNEKFVRTDYYNSPAKANIFAIQAQPGFKGGYNRDVYDSTASTSTLGPELLTLRDEVFIKIIKGELDVSYYDTYVAEYNKLGGDQLTKEAQEWWDAKH